MVQGGGKRNARRTAKKKNRGNNLFRWRYEADLGLEILVERLREEDKTLVYDRDALAEYETGVRSLAGQGKLIVAWGKLCGLQPQGPDVQRFLAETGNAFNLEYCPQCLDDLLAEVAYLALQHRRGHVDRHLDSQDRRAILEESMSMRRQMTSEDHGAVHRKEHDDAQ